MKKILTLLFVVASLSFAEPHGMIGAKLFTYNFDGSFFGYTAEVGLGGNISSGENGLVAGILSGIGRIDVSYESQEGAKGKEHKNNLVVPLKMYARQGSLGISIGYLISEFKQSEITSSVGIMLFLRETCSLNFDVIGSSGGAIGFAFHFGESKKGNEEKR